MSAHRPGICLGGSCGRLNEHLLDSLCRSALRLQLTWGACAGCPNGCARPYMAELGFVGDGPNSYQFWLGGSPNQTRLAEVFQDRVKIQVRPCHCSARAASK